MTTTPLLVAATVAIAVAAAALLLYGVICALVAWRFTTARRAPAQPAPVCAEAVRFLSRDGRARVDAWHLPASVARGAVVFVHGKDACRGDELKSPTFALARAFADAGLSVLMIDLRGHGISGAARLTYGASERFDVLGAVDWLRGRGHQRIGLLGASMGAATSMFAAADDPGVAAVVADSPFADFGVMIERQYRRLSHLPNCFLPGALALAHLATGVDLRRVRPLEAARALCGRPMLVIHSGGDRLVPVADARAIADSARADLWVTDTGGHLESYRADPEAYTKRVIAFLREHLVAPAPARADARIAAVAALPLAA